MLAISGRVSDLQAIVSVGVFRFSPGGSPTSSLGSPRIPISHYRALIDTGAQGTCLTAKVIHEVGLTSKSKVMVQSAGITRAHREYLVDIAMWYGEADQTDEDQAIGQRGYYGVGTHLAIDIDNNQNFDVIIGMDILTKCDFIMKRSGDFTLQI